MKWIEMMVKKLTARYMSLNRQFKVQRHTNLYLPVEPTLP